MPTWLNKAQSEMEHMTKIPQIRNMYFFNEASVAIDSISTAIEEKIKGKIDGEKYEFFCRNKFRRPVVDIYALFSPFNEATKAFQPFIHLLKNSLKKGDVILDIGNRAGWTSSMLAGLFPEQTVISFWEGDTDVLGYNGFAYWYANEDHPSNVKVAFGKLSGPLPFADKSIAVIFCLDLLHRQLRSTLINELVRISTDDGYILFPHVHMANADPSPFFQRGGDLIHGNVYDSFFKELKQVNKKGYVFSEPDLFRKSDNPKYAMTANPNTSDYNGLVALSANNVDLNNQLSAFNYYEFFALADGFLIPNPLLETDSTNSIILRRDELADEIKSLLENHPVYVDRIKNTIGYTLSDVESMVLYWAKKCRSVAFIRNILDMDEQSLKTVISQLQNLDILQILPVHERHVRLQHFLAYQTYTEGAERMNLQHLWKRAVTSFSGNTYVSDRYDNTFYTYQEFDSIVKCIAFTLSQAWCKKGRQDNAARRYSFRIHGVVLGLHGFGRRIHPDCIFSSR